MKSYLDLEVYQLAYEYAEGFGRRRYKAEFIRFLIFAHSSCDETISQLKMISDIHFPDDPLLDLINKYDKLGRKLNSFIQYVDHNWNTKNPQLTTRNPQPVTRNPNHATIQYT